MKLLVYLSAFIQLLIVNFQTIAQPPIKFHSITTKDGLAGDIVYALHQDKQGFLWIGTHRGLNRYDGYSFRLYVYDPLDTNSISGNHIHCIKEDADGILWLATNNGLNSLDPVSGKIKRYTLPNTAMDMFMEDIFLVNDSTILISAYLTLYRFNKRAAAFTKIAIPEREIPFGADKAKFTQDSNGNIFIGSPNYDCVIINWKNATATYLPSREILNALPKTDAGNNVIRQLYIDAQNNAWCFNGAAFLSKSINGKKIDYPYSNYPVTSEGSIIASFFEELNVKLWICTGDGLVLYDYANNSFYRYRQQKGNENSLPFNRVTTMLRDRNGVYWVGTFGGGICYFRLHPGFKNIIIDSGSNRGGNNVASLKTLYSGKLLACNSPSQMFIIEKNKIVHSFDLRKFFSDPITVDSFVLEYVGMPLQSFSEKDRLTLYSYFCNLKPDKHTLEPVLPFDKIQNYFNSNNLIISSNKKVWIRYGNDALSDRNHHPLTGLNHLIISITPTDDNNFLFATTQGLVLYNTKTNAVSKTYLPESGNPFSIASSSLFYILPDGKNNYWIATMDAGLDYWDTKTDRFYHYTTREGLPDNTVYMILPDKHGRLWLSTNKGLSCFDTATKTFTNYDTDDGLINTEFNRFSACTDKEGFMYFGGRDGIDYFHPDSFMQQSNPPALYVSGFKLHDKLQPINSVYTLGFNDNNISIEFTGNDFLNAKKIMFRYHLSDVDKEWMIEQGINKTGYNKLPPGKYRFSAQSSYNGKTWSQPLIVNFSIATPWFQSWWFFGLLLLFVAVCIYLLFRYRLQQQVKLLRVRNRIHRDLHDDVGATLSSVKAYSEILSNDPGNAVIAGLIKDNAADMIERLEVIA